MISGDHHSEHRWRTAHLSNFIHITISKSLFKTRTPQMPHLQQQSRTMRWLLALLRMTLQPEAPQLRQGPCQDTLDAKRQSTLDSRKEAHSQPHHLAPARFLRRLFSQQTAMNALAFVVQVTTASGTFSARRTSLLCVSPRPTFRPAAPKATLQTDAPTPATREQKNASLFPPCVPGGADEIECNFAIDMLRRVQWTTLNTKLPQSAVGTAHVVSPAQDNEPQPVLFMHGFDSNLLEYRYMMPLLDGQPKVEAHFLDILGWGLTEKPRVSGFSYGPDAKREHLRAYHEQVMGSKPMVLIGASVGGAVAIDFALRYPERVQALALLAPQAFTDKPASTLMQMFPIIASLGADVLRSDWLRNQAVQIAYESEKLKSRDTLRIGGLHCKSEGWKEAAIDFIKGEGYCLSDKVRDIKCPTLVLWGENDRVLPKGDSQKCLDNIHNCKLEIVKGSGHSPHIEKPSLVTRHILDFLPHSLDTK